jgi:hypothetical protein
MGEGMRTLRGNQTCLMRVCDEVRAISGPSRAPSYLFMRDGADGESHAGGLRTPQRCTLRLRGCCA